MEFLGIWIKNGHHFKITYYVLGILLCMFHVTQSRHKILEDGAIILGGQGSESLRNLQDRRLGRKGAIFNSDGFVAGT